MRDPHVVALYYQLKHSNRVEFKEPPPLSVSAPEFDAFLADGVLRVSLHEHYARRDSAREVVEPFLRSWELHVALESGRKDVWFEFDHAEIIDRNPPAAGESYVLQAEGSSHVVFGSNATLTTSRKSYPPPDYTLVASAHAEAMWHRYEGYINGREPLPGMANACMTLLEGTTEVKGGVKAALCTMYSIARNVRDTLGRLISEKGDIREARKLGASSTLKPFTEKERSWIEEVVKRLIRRKGEYDANPTASFPEITMNDLPKL